MQALEEPELPENFFQLSVGLLEKGKSFFQREQAFLGFLLFLQVHEWGFVLLCCLFGFCLAWSLMKKDDDRRERETA